MIFRKFHGCRGPGCWEYRPPAPIEPSKMFRCLGSSPLNIAAWKMDHEWRCFLQKMLDFSSSWWFFTTHLKIMRGCQIGSNVQFRIGLKIYLFKNIYIYIWVGHLTWSLAMLTSTAVSSSLPIRNKFSFPKAPPDRAECLAASWTLCQKTYGMTSWQTSMEDSSLLMLHSKSQKTNQVIFRKSVGGYIPIVRIPYWRWDEIWLMVRSKSR